MTTPKRNREEEQEVQHKKVKFAEPVEITEDETCEENEENEENEEFDYDGFHKWALESESKRTWTNEEIAALFQAAVAYDPKDYGALLKIVLKLATDHVYTNDEITTLCQVFEVEKACQTLVQMGKFVEVSPGLYEMAGNDSLHPLVVSDSEEN